MSIVASIQTHEGTGALRRVQPPPGKPSERGALLTHDAQQQMDNAQSVVGLLGAKAFVQAMLERWVSGGRMPVRLTGTKPGAFMALLTPPPDDVWEFRVTEPINHIRVFCRFVRPDLVVVTNMNSRRLLGRKGSTQWTNAMNKSVTEWNNLFPGHSPYQGSMVGDHVTKSYTIIG